MSAVDKHWVNERHLTMYYAGQIVYDKDKQEPVAIGDDVWDRSSYPERHTHFLYSKGAGKLELYMPKTVEHAKVLLARGIIVPAPSPLDHCWECGNWKSNCSAFKKCPEWDQHGKDIFAQPETQATKKTWP